MILHADENAAGQFELVLINFCQGDGHATDADKSETCARPTIHLLYASATGKF